MLCSMYACDSVKITADCISGRLRGGHHLRTCGQRGSGHRHQPGAIWARNLGLPCCSGSETTLKSFRRIKAAALNYCSQLKWFLHDFLCSKASVIVCFYDRKSIRFQEPRYLYPYSFFIDKTLVLNFMLLLCCLCHKRLLSFSFQSKNFSNLINTFEIWVSLVESRILNRK